MEVRLRLPAAALLLLLVPTSALQHDHQQDGRLGYIPQPSLHSLPLGSVEQALDMLADLLQEATSPSGERRVFSQLATPTLFAVNDICQRHTDILLQEFLNGSLWATAMIDSTGKLPDGILVGNINALGSFDECLYIDKTLDNETYPDLSEKDLHFVGRYVPVRVAVSSLAAADSDVGDMDSPQAEEDSLGAILLPTQGLMGGVVGMCVPSSCSSEDVRDGLQTLLGTNVTVMAFTSSTKEDTVSLRPGDIIVITIMTIVGALMAAGTALDLYHRRYVKQQAEKLKITSVVDSSNPRLAEMLYVTEPNPSKMQQRRPPVLSTGQRALIAFSVYTNTKKLMDTTTSKGTLTCLHGIRFFSMTWVVMGHAVTQLLFANQNFFVFFDWFKGPWFQVVANATPSVDTFFVLSGTLLAYGFCSAYEKTKKFNLATFYIHRYLRLTPPLAIMVAFTATLFVYLGDGPFWGLNVEKQAALCQDYWWRNLLYIQNFFEFEEICLGQSWYLANDIQMFLFAPLVLLPLVWKPLLGMVWLCTLIIGFLALRVALWSVKELPPTILGFNKPDLAAADELMVQYAYSWMRCTVWLTGIGLGYVLHRLRGRQLKLKPWLWMSGWIAAFAMGISVVYGMTGYQMPWEPYSKLVAVSYGGLHRTAWGLAVAWVIFACVTGYGGVINTFLSYPGFIPLSRLTYAGYLVHINVILTVEGSVKGTLYVDALRVIYRYLAHVITTFAFALALSLAFEAPFINLEKIMFESRKRDNGLGDAPAGQPVDTAKAETEVDEQVEEDAKKNNV